METMAEILMRSGPDRSPWFSVKSFAAMSSPSVSSGRPSCSKLKKQKEKRWKGREEEEKEKEWW